MIHVSPSAKVFWSDEELAEREQRLGLPPQRAMRIRFLQSKEVRDNDSSLFFDNCSHAIWKLRELSGLDLVNYDAVLCAHQALRRYGDLSYEHVTKNQPTKLYQLARLPFLRLSLRCVVR